MAFPQTRGMRGWAAANVRDQGARRRMRRAQHYYCATNGCASFLELDPGTGIATCPICGYRRQIGH